MTLAGKLILTAPETINHSRDKVGAHQTVNGSRDLITPLSGMVYHPSASTYYRQPSNCPSLAPFLIYGEILVENRRFNLRHLYLAPTFG